MAIICFRKSLRSLVTEEQSLYAPNFLCLPHTEHEMVNLRAPGNRGSFGIELYKGRKLLITYMKREIVLCLKLGVWEAGDLRFVSSSYEGFLFHLWY